MDLAAFGRPAVLVWHKRRWRCPEPACEVKIFTEAQSAIAAARAGVTDRAGRWMTRQVGQGQPVSAVAAELGCAWHTVMDAVVAYGTPLIEDAARIGAVTALGLDETLFVRTGPWRRRCWVTSIVDVSSPAQLRFAGLVETFVALGEQASRPVERVALVAAVAERVVLDPASDVVETSVGQ